MAGLRDTIKNEFAKGNYLIKVLLILVGVFLLQTIVGVVSALTQTDLNYFLEKYTYLPSNIVDFAFRPWTLFTYMFFHVGFRHILINGIILFFSGRIFVDFLNEKRFLGTFILGGLAGGLLFILSYNVFPLFEGTKPPLVGASAGVMAIVIATAAYAPNMPVRLFFILEVKLWHVAAIFLILDLVNLPISNPGGHIAHLGGAAMGYIIVKQLAKGKDWSMGFFEYMQSATRWLERKPKLKTVHKTKAQRATQTKASAPKSSDQERLDQILEKIQKSGYEKLSKEEKEFLFKFGKQ